VKAASVGARAAQQDRQQVALLIDLLAQRRGQLLGGFERVGRGGDVGGGGLAKRLLLAGQVQQTPVSGDDAVRRFQLGVQAGELNGGAGDVGGQGQKGRAGLIPLGLGLGRDGLHLPAHAAEDVEVVTEVQLALEERVALRIVRQRRGDRKGVLRPDRIAGEIDAGPERGALGQVEFARLPQRRLRGLQVRIGLQRLLLERVEFGRAEQGPPAGGHRTAGEKALRRRAGGLRRQGLGGVAIGGRGRRPLEVRPHRAAADQRRGEAARARQLPGSDPAPQRRAQVR
jgi:hypothetical protein